MTFDRFPKAMAGLLLALSASLPAVATTVDNSAASHSWFVGLVYLVCALIPLSLLLGGIWSVNTLVQALFAQICGPVQELPDKLPRQGPDTKTILAYGLTAANVLLWTVTWPPSADACSSTDLGIFGWPLEWAAVFAPWFVFGSWPPPSSGTVSTRRAGLLLLAGSSALGWIYHFRLWSPA